MCVGEHLFSVIAHASLFSVLAAESQRSCGKHSCPGMGILMGWRLLMINVDSAADGEWRHFGSVWLFTVCYAHTNMCAIKRTRVLLMLASQTEAAMWGTDMWTKSWSYTQTLFSEDKWSTNLNSQLGNSCLWFMWEGCVYKMGKSLFSYCFLFPLLTLPSFLSFVIPLLLA